MRTPILFLLSCLAASSATWPPVPAEELTAKTPGVQKDAHAEANLWEVWVTDDVQSGYPHSVLKHYIRIKIFDQRGVEMMSKVDLLYRTGTRISNVAGRTTKPNGESIDMTKDAIFDRVVIKGRGTKFRALSFALPALEPGAVIEYGWQEYKEEALANYVELDLQREIPVRLVRYHLHPLQSPWFPFAMRYTAYQAKTQPFVPERNGYFVASWSGMPAFTEEPDMPAEHNVRAWMLVYYEEDRKLSPDKYWQEQGKKLFAEVKQELKINGDVKDAAVRLTEGASTEEAKLAKLFAFCQTKIRNINGAHANLTPEERERFKPNKNTSDTLKQGIGTGRDIDLLFTALALAGGFDARFARNSDREIATFDPGMANGWFMSRYDVAVRVGEKWLFFDPAAQLVPFGMLRWQEEGTFALIADPKEPAIVPTPIAPAAKSARTRVGNFSVSEDGSLQGIVRIEYRGHLATEERARYIDESDEQIVEDLSNRVKRQFGDAEITEIRHQDLLDGSLGVVESFRVRVAGYAQRTGKRLFVRPSFFESGAPARYTASERKYPVQFPFPWTESDRVTFVLPEGFELDHGEMPSPLDFGEGHFKLRATYVPSERKLEYARELVFGKNGNLYLAREAYPMLKSIFSDIHAADEHALSFRQVAAGAGK